MARTPARPTRTARPAPLLGPVARPRARVAVAVALLVLAVLSLALAGFVGEGALDRALDGPVIAALEPHPWLVRPLVDLGELWVVLPVLAVVLVVALRRGHRRLAVLAVAGPALGNTATALLKPAVGRDYAGSDAFPSGHMTAVVGVALVLLVALLGSGAAHRTRVAAITVGAVLVVGSGLALVAAHYHFATDVLGGAAVATASVLGMALLLDRAPRAGP